MIASQRRSRSSVLLSSTPESNEALLKNAIHDIRNKTLVLMSTMSLYDQSLLCTDYESRERVIFEFRDALEDLQSHFYQMRGSEIRDQVLSLRNRIPNILAQFFPLKDIEESEMDYFNCLQVCKEMYQLINQIKSVKGDTPTEGSMQYSDPEGLVRNIVNRYARLYPNTEFELDYLPCPGVFFMPASITRALENLIKNAIDSLPDEKGKIKVRAFKKAFSRSSRPFSEIQEGEYYTIQVIDNGSGIPGDVMREIPTSFVTTKNGGSGIGLKSVRASMFQHRGYFFIESEEGEYTKATTLLPTNQTLERHSTIRPTNSLHDALTKGNIVKLSEIKSRS